MLFFSEEVLSRYYDHPEFYDVRDSLSGGQILSNDTAPEKRYTYVRYGKRRSADDYTVVAAMLRDLSRISADEQNHWLAHQLTEHNFENDDIHFYRFLRSSYGGEFTEREDPLGELLGLIRKINEIFVDRKLFKRDQNAFLRVPVENTRKAYVDCCSELYKLIGPDNLDLKIVKEILKDKYFLDESEFVHESGRPLSPLQLLQLLEEKMQLPIMLSSIIRKIRDERIESAHKITEPGTVEVNYVDLFLMLCMGFIDAGSIFLSSIRQIISI